MCDEAGGLLAEDGGEPGEGPPPAGRVVAAFEPADGGGADSRPVGELVLGQAVLVA